MRNTCLFHLASQVGKYEHKVNINLHNILFPQVLLAQEYEFFQTVKIPSTL